MKRIIAVFTAAVMLAAAVFSLSACGGGDDAGTSNGDKGEIAMIVDADKLKEGSFSEDTWKSLQSVCEENSLTCKYYTTKNPSQETYLTSIQKAVDEGAKMIILPGANFETTAYAAQSAYPDVYFLIIDGVPHDGNDNYATSANTVSIIFAEEEAGYLAGYAAVKEGYKNLGFMGGQELPSVKRYGYGFVQGAAAAAAENEEKVTVRYHYTGTFDESDEVKALAEKWYDEKTKVIFACGGAMNNSVISAAEEKSGLVIGSDIDQSALSETVITSAEKSLETAISDIVGNYADDKFTGSMAFNYAAKNNGVALEMENSKLETFTEENYNKVFNKLKSGEIELKKDTSVKAVTELAGDFLTIQAE